MQSFQNQVRQNQIRQNQTRRPMAFNRIPALVCTCSALVALAGSGCATEDVHPDVMIVSSLTDTASGIGKLHLTAVRDDIFYANPQPYQGDPTTTTWTREVPPYRLMIDGRLAAWEGGEYVHIYGDGGKTGIELDVGQHAVSLVDESGAVTFTTPAFDIREGVVTEVAILGGPNTLRSVAMVDDAVVPLGSVRVRLVNALDDHRPVELVKCPNGIPNRTLPGAAAEGASSCVAVGGPVAYGELLEVDGTGAEFANRVGWRLAPSLSVVNHVWELPLDPSQAQGLIGFGDVISGRQVGGFATQLAMHVMGPDSECPTCGF
jgi:hypothetical protein